MPKKKGTSLYLLGRSPYSLPLLPLRLLPFGREPILLQDERPIEDAKPHTIEILLPAMLGVKIASALLAVERPEVLLSAVLANDHLDIPLSGCCVGRTGTFSVPVVFFPVPIKVYFFLKRIQPDLLAFNIRFTSRSLG